MKNTYGNYRADYYEGGSLYGSHGDSVGFLETLKKLARQFIRMDAFISEVDNFKIVDSDTDQVIYEETLPEKEIKMIRDMSTKECARCEKEFQQCGCKEFSE